MDNLSQLTAELQELDKELVQIDGVHLKPSQCYHFETDPAHILYNTNCPDSLREKIDGILKKHLGERESGSEA